MPTTATSTDRSCDVCGELELQLSTETLARLDSELGGSAVGPITTFALTCTNGPVTLLLRC